MLYVRVPNTKLAIRIWPGGMQQYDHCWFDFFDLVDHVPVNTPEGFKLTPLPKVGMVPCKGRLCSWEETFEVKNIQQGLEKYCVAEGMSIALTYPGEAPFGFQIPSRPAEGFAQPQPGIPPI